MHRTPAVRGARLVQHCRAQRLGDSDICLLCQHQSITTSLQRREGHSESDNISPAERKRRQNVSATQKTLLARDKILEKLRGKIWKGAPPGADDPYTGESKSRSVTKEPADEDLVVIGGEDGAESDEDVRRHYRRQAKEERKRYQQSIEEAPTHKEYVPALRWEGLEVVGGEKEWDVGVGQERYNTFRGFLPKQKVTSPALLTYALHRAAVEVWYAQSTGQDARKLPRVGPANLLKMDGVAHKVSMKPSQDGLGVDLSFPDEDTEAALRDQIDSNITREESTVQEHDDIASEEAGAIDANEEAVDLEQDIGEQEAIVTPSIKPAEVLGNAWTAVAFNDPDTRLGIAHRVAQLTSLVLPSRMFNEKHATLGNVLRYLHDVVSSPATTFEQLVGTQYASENPLGSVRPNQFDQFDLSTHNNEVIGPLEQERYGSKSALQGLSNVVVHGRRWTPIDREKEAGRWKIIEKTLKERGLPVTGMGGNGGLQRIRPSHRP